MTLSAQPLAYQFPNSKQPRWLVRRARIADFWRILPANGLRGTMKRSFARYLLPTLGFLLPRAVADMGDSDYIYLGVDDGKRTQLSVKLDSGLVVFEKTCTDDASLSFLKHEAKIMEKLINVEVSNFPRFVSFEANRLKFYGALPRAGFNPRRSDHREKLIGALVQFYRKFGVRRDEDGAVICMSHGDLNKWNMFIDTNDQLHMFDFETAREGPLGIDLVTSYIGELPQREFETILRLDLLSLAKALECCRFEADRQIQKILDAT